MNKKEEDEFESMLDIDETQLDKQSREQPRLVWQYGRMLAEAIRSLDYADAELKVAMSELDESIRSNPQDYGIEKVTEAGIKNALARTKDYQTANDKLIKARYELNVLQAAKEALEHRRTSLSNFVRLNEQNYFSHPHKTQIEDNELTGWQKRKKKKR